MVEPKASVFEPGVTMAAPLVWRDNDRTLRIEGSGMEINGSPVVTAHSLRATVGLVSFEFAFLGVLLALVTWSAARGVYRKAREAAWLRRQPSDPSSPYREGRQRYATAADVELATGWPADSPQATKVSIEKVHLG